MQINSLQKRKKLLTFRFLNLCIVFKMKFKIWEIITIIRIVQRPESTIGCSKSDQLLIFIQKVQGDNLMQKDKAYKTLAKMSSYSNYLPYLMTTITKKTTIQATTLGDSTVKATQMIRDLVIWLMKSTFGFIRIIILKGRDREKDRIRISSKIRRKVLIWAIIMRSKIRVIEGKLEGRRRCKSHILCILKLLMTNLWIMINKLQD